MCFHQFSSLKRLETHLKRKTPCKSYNNQETNVKLEVVQLNDDGKKISDRFPCQYCHTEFIRKDNVTAHLRKNRCPVMKNNMNCNQVENINAINIDKLTDELKAELRAELRDEFEQKSQVLEKEIAELREKPTINNQVLQVI
jgi:hypothetical protein